MNLPKRKSPRASFLDYDEGVFFVTICTAGKLHYFGFIKNEEMHLSAIGKFLDENIQEIPMHNPDTTILNYVIMPNHVHLILEICKAQQEVISATQASDEILKNQGMPEQLTQETISTDCYTKLINHRDSRLAVVIGGMKSAVSRYASRNNFEFGWQKRYHDHLIRGNHDGDRIWNYVDNNIFNWDKDCFNRL